MEILGSGLVTLANGAWEAVSVLASPMAVAVLVSALSLLWLAMVEVEELDRQGSKPQVGRH